MVALKSRAKYFHAMVGFAGYPRWPSVTGGRKGPKAVQAVTGARGYTGGCTRVVVAFPAPRERPLRWPPGIRCWGRWRTAGLAGGGGRYLPRGARRTRLGGAAPARRLQRKGRLRMGPSMMPSRSSTFLISSNLALMLPFGKRIWPSPSMFENVSQPSSTRTIARSKPSFP